MTVIQRPGSREFCATMPDYIIDTDKSITFVVKYKGKEILNEEYVPDKNYQVRVRNLGRFCRLALWGEWSTGNVFKQENVAGSFTFLINGAQDTVTYVMFSRMKTKKSATDTGWFSELREKVTRAGAKEYASALCASGNAVTVTAKRANGTTPSATLYTHSGDTAIVTLEVSIERISALFSGATDILNYQLTLGGHTIAFMVDQRNYTDINCFRCKNVYDLPETVTTVGTFTVKGNNESDTAAMYYTERKFDVKVTDEYTAKSGTIYFQSDYKLWHNLVNAQEVSVLIQGEWYPIIITSQVFEREFNKGALKEVEFSFRMANPEDNNIIDV